MKSKVIIVFFILINVFSSYGQNCLSEITKGEKSQFSKLQRQARLGEVSDQEYLKRHPVYQRIKHLNDRELLTRAVFAEGISTHFFSDEKCLNQSEIIFQALAWGIKNRVTISQQSKKYARRFGKGIAGVLFKVDQFNPSVSPNVEYSRLLICPQSFYKDVVFTQATCRQKKTIFNQQNFKKYWQQAEKAAIEALNNKKIPISLLKVTSFYYPLYVYSTEKNCLQYKEPQWAKEEKALKKIQLNGQSLSINCVRFFND